MRSVSEFDAVCDVDCHVHGDGNYRSRVCFHSTMRRCRRRQQRPLLVFRILRWRLRILQKGIRVRPAPRNGKRCSSLFVVGPQIDFKIHTEYNKSGSVLSRRLFGEFFLKVSIPPPQRPLLFPALKTISFDFPTVNLVSYTEKHHTSPNNSPNIEWDKEFQFFLYFNNIIVSGEAILSAENSGKSLGGRGSAPNPAEGAHSAPRPPSWWTEGLLPLFKNPPSLSAFGLDFRPFAPHSAAFPKSLHFPQCSGVSIKHCFKSSTQPKNVSLG